MAITIEEQAEVLALINNAIKAQIPGLRDYLAVFAGGVPMPAPDNNNLGAPSTPTVYYGPAGDYTTPTGTITTTANFSAFFWDGDGPWTKLELPINIDSKFTTGKNLYNKANDLLNKAIEYTSGQLVAASGANVSEPIPIASAKYLSGRVEPSGPSLGGGMWGARYLDANGNLLAGVYPFGSNYGNTLNGAINPPADAKFFQFTTQVTGVSNANIQLEEGTTQTAFEPYAPTSGLIYQVASKGLSAQAFNTDNGVILSRKLGNALSIPDRVLTGEPVKDSIGLIYENQNFTNLNDFTVVGDAGIYSYNNGRLIISPTAPLGNGGVSDADRLQYKNPTALDYWTQEVVFVMTAQSTTGLGVLTGVRSLNTFFDETILTYLSTNSTSADYGKLICYCTANDKFVKSDVAIPITVGDRYRVSTTCEPKGFTVTVRNLDTGIKAFLYIPKNYNYNTGGANASHDHNTGRWTLENNGNGKYEILSYRLLSAEKINPYILEIGDSKLRKCFPGTYSQRSSNLLGYPVQAGSGDRTTEVLLRLPEVINVIKPVWVVINIGFNNLFDYQQHPGTAKDLNTTLADYNTIYNTLTGAGIKVKFCIPEASNQLDVTPLKTWLDANYPGSIDLFTASKADNGTGMKPEYNSGDGIHMNATGIFNMAKVKKAALLAQNIIF